MKIGPRELVVVSQSRSNLRCGEPHFGTRMIYLQCHPFGTILLMVATMMSRLSLTNKPLQIQEAIFSVQGVLTLFISMQGIIMYASP